MHSSLPQQLENFEFTRSPLLKRLFARMERFVLRNSQAVIVICPDLMDRVRAEGFGDKAILIENVLDFPAPETGPGGDRAAEARAGPGRREDHPLRREFRPVSGRIRSSSKPPAVSGRRRSSSSSAEAPGNGRGSKPRPAALGLAGRIVVLDRVAPTRVPLFVQAADVLVSPRMSGTNTPLKIYSFLKSGKPLVATRLYTHTQVLDDAISVLVEPTPEAMAAGLDFALEGSRRRRRGPRPPRRSPRREYTFEAYRDRIARCLGMAVENFGH